MLYLWSSILMTLGLETQLLVDLSDLVSNAGGCGMDGGSVGQEVVQSLDGFGGRERAGLQDCEFEGWWGQSHARHGVFVVPALLRVMEKVKKNRKAMHVQTSVFFVTACLGGLFTSDFRLGGARAQGQGEGSTKRSEVISSVIAIPPCSSISPSFLYSLASLPFSPSPSSSYNSSCHGPVCFTCQAGKGDLP